MIISVLHLSRSDFEAIRERNKGVFDTYTIHKIVYSLFPPEPDKEGRNFLYSYKGGDFNEKRILILSKIKPLHPDIGEIESKEVPKEFLNQDYYGFEIQMNPVKRDSKTGKIIAIRGNSKEELESWFTEKAKSYGFEVLNNSLFIEDTNVLKFTKDNKNVVLGKAVFKGRLKVTDRELFIHSFENGLGKGKAFGFGLFQIVPLTNAQESA